MEWKARLTKSASLSRAHCCLLVPHTVQYTISLSQSQKFCQGLNHPVCGLAKTGKDSDQTRLNFLNTSMGWLGPGGKWGYGYRLPKKYPWVPVQPSIWLAVMSYTLLMYTPCQSQSHTGIVHDIVKVGLDCIPGSRAVKLSWFAG